MQEVVGSNPAIPTNQFIEDWRLKIGVLAVAALAAAGPGIFASARNARVQVQIDARRQQRLQHIEDLRTRQGLHAAALASDGRRYVGFEMIDVELVAADLETVAEDSDLVLRGTIGHNLSRLAKDEDGKETVVLDYRVSVHDVFTRRDAAQSDVITWTVPGGVYLFEDGASVEILTPAFRKPLPGEEYVLFLRKDETFGNYKLAFGTQSLFRIDADGRVEAGTRDHPTSAGLPMGVDAFLARVRAAVKAREK